MSELQTPDDGERNRAFKEQLETGEQMVHRLRDWTEGDIVWGWTQKNNGASMGKTFTRTDEHPDSLDLTDPAPGHKRARIAYESAAENSASGAVFLWVGRIESVRTAPRGPDPGEPPLKFARLTNVHVLDSEVIDAD